MWLLEAMWVTGAGFSPFFFKAFVFVIFHQIMNVCLLGKTPFFFFFVLASNYVYLFREPVRDVSSALIFYRQVAPFESIDQELGAAGRSSAAEDVAWNFFGRIFFAVRG